MKHLLLASFLFWSFLSTSQVNELNEKTRPSFSQVQEKFYEHFEELEEEGLAYEEEEEADGLMSKFKRWEWLMQTRLMPDGTLPEPGFAAKERDNYFSSHPEAAALRNASWSQIGTSVIPSGGGAGRVNVIRFDPANASTIYIGTAGGGVWKSTNDGSTWSPVSDNIANLSIADIAIDPSDGNNIYIATGDGYGYELGSSGDFWGGLYSGGVLHSIDGGATWNTTGLSYNQSDKIIIQRLVIDPSSAQNLLAATKNGIMRSTDGGTTWAQTLSGRYYDIEYNTSNSATVYCSGNNNLYKSTDGGATWSTMKTSVGWDRVSLEVTAANSQVIYALAIGGSLWNSTDGGATWATKTYPSGANFYGYYDGVLACSNANSDYLLAGGSNLVKSTNGGSSWTSLSGIHVDMKALAFVPGNTSAFYVGNDGGIYKTTNGGSGWTNLSSGLTIAQIYRVASSATDPNIIYSGWQDNGTNRWNGNSTSWSQVYGADGMDCMVDYNNSQIVYASYQYGVLLKSTNGGSSFSNISPATGGNWVTPFEMDPQNSSTIYAGYTSIYRSSNSGTSWTNIGSSLFSGSNNGCEDIAIANSDVNTIYACSFTKIVKTLDGGSAWTTITGALPVSYTGFNQIAVSSSDPSKVWVCLGGYSSGNKVFNSTDGGNTWINISGTLPNIPVNSIVHENNSPDRVYIGTDLGVYYLDNDNSDWVYYSDGLPNVMVHELEINYTSNKLIAGTYGRGLWHSDLVGSVIVNQSVIALSGNMNFGDVPAGTSSQRTLTISNSGNIPMNVSSLSHPSGFSGDWSGSIPGGGSQNVTVTFSPSSVQGYSGIITVNSDANTGTNTMNCSGTGITNTTIITHAITPVSLCPNSSVTVSYTASGIFDSGNIFTAQLSNSSGSFASPFNIGTLNSNQSGTINCTIPLNVTGSGFIIRGRNS